MVRVYLLRPLLRLAAPILRDQRGVSILEFALIAPVLCLMLAGSLDYAHTLYMQGLLQGTLQKAARDSTLQTAAGSSATQRDAIDAIMRTQLQRLNKTATVTTTRRFYRTFSKANSKTAESFTDTNGDGTCNNGEPFEDTNNNDVRDADGGDSVDHASARDNVVYTVTLTYRQVFPLNKLLGVAGNTTTLTASTVLANQPFGAQQEYEAATVGHCTS